MSIKPPAYLSKLMSSERIAVARNLLNKEKNLISTDSVALDWALGGGVPLGELVMFWGPPGSGKTLQALKLIAKMQKKHTDKFAIWIDTEYSFDPKRAMEMGVDVDRLIVFQSNTFEGAIAPLGKIEEEIKEQKNICAIVLDSVKGLQSINSEGQMAEGKVDSAANAFGGIAKSVNPALHVLVRIANECGILTVLTNHANMNMDPMTAKYEPYILTGGQMLKHLCSTVVLLEKPNNAKSKLFSTAKDSYGNDIKYGSMIRCTVNKTRMTVEGKKAEFAQNLETGEIERKEEELFRLAKGLGVIKSEGRNWYFRDPSLGIKAQFESGFVELLSTDPNVFAKVLEDCKSAKILDAVSANLTDDAIEVE